MKKPIDLRRSGKVSGFAIAILALSIAGCQNNAPELSNDRVKISWKKTDDVWKTASVNVKVDDQWKEVGTPSGEYMFLYSPGKPDSTLTVFKTSTGVVFPEPVYKYQKQGWAEATHPVTLNTAGLPVHSFPNKAQATENEVKFTSDHELATITSTWKIDPAFPTDVLVSQVLVAKRDGYYSLATPTLTTISSDDVSWATVPGYFQSNDLESDFVATYAYGHGVPDKPVLYRERTISTLTSIIDTKDGASFAVVPAPGLARDPWRKDKITQNDWSIGLSHRNRKSELTPTLYYPVLGEPQSKLHAGDTIQYNFRFILKSGNWFDNLRHTVYDVYDFKEGLALRGNRQSLSDRIRKMHHYLTDTKTSMWNVEIFDGVKIGAQSYLGGVVGSNKDAMKNADYGAMWMLASATDDPFLKKNVLPYAYNFKMKQQETSPGFFQGAAIGQYYLAKRKMFVEEWGEFIEPISLTYYTMLDIGNMMLFEPDDQELKRRLKLGGDLLLKWQHEDGSWVVAYDRETHQPLFQDIKDLRPTFYGLVVAYRMLKDQQYLDGAIKGADWLIANGVNKGHFIGVCGDARYAPDFATGQTAQALLDLYDLTKDEKYRDAAIRTAQIYTTSIYTHPIPSTETKRVKNVTREDWEIAQAGLSFEHGGLMGSAQRHGPIQLASHAGLFVRVFGLTNDSIFIDMARAAAIGRDAFVDSTTSVASYYWNAMNRGAGPYPHHAWWQIGWITDYLMAEAELRSKGEISFPRGFVAPKVGPHQSYGFDAGSIYGQRASLIIRDGLVNIKEPNIEFITAISPLKDKLFVVLMNAVNQPLSSSVRIDLNQLRKGLGVKEVYVQGSDESIGNNNEWDVQLDGYGLKTFTIHMK
ncbi:MAG TPA: glycerophosphoryl diester phosphodiesterase [Chryseosolibacter sp.]|nr:glycerophosphoryl diester phosphodiesterase [Chryseosolibacter sp.]